ncbi:MAG: tetratricopeptide repeat protein, partial [Bacteroidota bacterium]
MKKYFFIMLAVAAMTAVGQKKPKIGKAKSALEKAEYAEAKTIIDAAIDFEKTKNDPKTWYYRGQIYMALDTAMQQEGAIETAMEAYKKALELDPEQSKVSEFTGTGIANVDTKVQEYYAYYYNNGLASYEAEKFAEASTAFDKAFFITPSDTNAIINSAYAAMNADNIEKAASSFKKALDAGARERGIYLRLYNFALQAEDLESALEAIRMGKKEHPQDVDLMKFEVNLLIQLKKADEAIGELLKAIELEPDNADLYFSLGVLREELGEKDAAIESYKKAIAIDQDHFNSSFNLAVFTFNVANEMIKERNDLSYKEVKKSDELKAKIDAQLTEALPLWERLYDLKPKDQTVLETLSYIYTFLKMD